MHSTDKMMVWLFMIVAGYFLMSGIVSKYAEIECARAGLEQRVSEGYIIWVKPDVK